jgi:membrane associated rhomboid family serine protease
VPVWVVKGVIRPRRLLRPSQPLYLVKQPSVSMVVITLGNGARKAQRNDEDPMFIPIHDDNPLRTIRFQWVTLALVIVNCIVFSLELTQRGTSIIGSFAIIPNELLKMGWIGNAALGPLDTWPIPERATLLTYQFFHGDILHLATNMAFLWVFGDNVEDAMGHVRFVVFYLVCGIAGGLAHAVAMPASKIPLIGASGAVAGVVAAYVMLHPKVKVWILALRIIPLNVSAAIALGAWIVLQFVMIFVKDINETAWWAHIGGIVMGAILIVLLRRPGYPLFDQRVRAAIAVKTSGPTAT